MNSIRIVEFPACKAVTSGYAMNEAPFEEGGKILKFGEWWTKYDKKRKDRWFSRDFIMYGREEKALIWFYAVPEEAEVECEYDVVDFEGGLYAAAVAIDSNFDDEQRIYGGIKEWVKQRGTFELDERPGHYDLSHVITPEYIAKQMGYMQLEIYLPIKLRQKQD